MAPKSRKSLSPWFECEICHVMVTQKDLPTHVKGSCPPSVTSWSHGFIKDQVLFSTLEEFKCEDGVPNIPKQESRKLVLLSQSALQLCQMCIGDPVIVTCHGATYVKTAWPTQEKSLTSVLMTREAMECFRTHSPSLVTVEKLSVVPVPAQQVLVQPTGLVQMSAILLTLLRQNHQGAILCQGNKLQVPYYGKTVVFDVQSITPFRVEQSDVMLDDLVENVETMTIDEVKTIEKMGQSPGAKVGSSSVDSPSVQRKSVKFFKVVVDTKWVLAGKRTADSKGEPKSFAELSSIGGLSEVIEELKELASLALESTPLVPGLRATRGILLFGVSGTGKTLLANALAASTKAAILSVSGGEIYSKYFGETEARLKDLFVEAKQKAPSVILMDELDSLCPKRSSSSSEQEKRVVAMLVTLLDTLHEPESGPVLVLATSSRPDALDPALRRPGRIDREVEICVPNPAERLDILRKLLPSAAHQVNDEDMKEVAMAAHGFVGADLAALGSKAGLHAAKRNESIALVDLSWALTQVKPSAMREVLVQVPNVKWSDIGGQHDLKLKLRQAVEWPLKHPEAFTRLGISPPRGVLMFGPPGCSKTMVAKALATESKLNFLAIKGPELFSKWVGESERAVREVFRRARQVAPSVVFFDELDALGGERGRGASQSGGSNVQERVLAQLLIELDGVEPLGNVTVLAATNRPDRIDKALLRPGRLDRIVYVPLPDDSTRTEIFNLQLRKMPVAADVQVEELVARTEGYSGAEVLAVCHEAALKALEQDLSAEQVNGSHFSAALDLVTPRTPPSLLQLYEDYLKV